MARFVLRQNERGPFETRGFEFGTGLPFEKFAPEVDRNLVLRSGKRERGGLAVPSEFEGVLLSALPC